LSTVVKKSTVFPPGGSIIDLGSLSPAVYGPDISFLAYGSFPSTELITTRGGLHTVTDSSAMPTALAPLSPLSMDSKGYAFGASYSKNSQLYAGYATVTNAGALNASAPQFPIPRFITRDGQIAQYFYFPNAGNPGQLVLSTPGFSQYYSYPVPGQEFPANLLPGQASGYVHPAANGGPQIFSADDFHNTVFSAAAQDTAMNPLFYGLFIHPAGGATQMVVDDHTVIPGFDGTTTFNLFSNVAIDRSVVAFIGGGGNTSGIFAWSGGSLIDVISDGDLLNGKTVSSLSFSTDRPLSGNDLVFTVGFTDGSTGLYLAEVPEPSVMGLLMCAGFAAGLARRAKRS
jgi:hypothetical protein